jgi:hypothetical protein
VHAAYQYFGEHESWGPLDDLFPDRLAIAGLTRSGISIVNGKPAPTKLPKGLCFVKSPKGSGKTEALRGLLADAGSALLIGHRRALIRQSCQRLGLDCYLDAEGSPTRRFGICLDSLLRIRAPQKYDVVVLDESEQLLAHFLADTLEHSLGGGGRERLFVEFARLVASAKHVIALDADLGYATFETINTMRVTGVRPRVPKKKAAVPAASAEPEPTVRVWLNEAKVANGRVIHVYSSEAHLVAELTQALADGKRCFVTSNTKTKIENLSELIKSQLGDAAKQIVITSDTTAREDVKAFIADVKAQTLDYQVVLTSPSLGTGVDITFPDEAQLVDVVFGFFGPNVNTHLDCDQQLARVRHPGEVKVWVTPARFQYETNREVIRQDIIRNSLFKNLLLHYEQDEPVYRDDPDPFIDMAALIRSEQTASKNSLKNHFLTHKRWQGWRVVEVQPNESLTEAGRELMQLGRYLSQEKLIEELAHARPIDRAEFCDIQDRIDGDGTVTGGERWSLQRAKIELFYRQPVSRDLVLLDDRGRYRSRVFRYQYVADPEFSRLAAAAADIEHKYRFLKTTSEIALAIARLLAMTPLYRDGEFNSMP